MKSTGTFTVEKGILAVNGVDIKIGMSQNTLLKKLDDSMIAMIFGNCGSNKINTTKIAEVPKDANHLSIYLKDTSILGIKSCTVLITIINGVVDDIFVKLGSKNNDNIKAHNLKCKKEGIKSTYADYKKDCPDLLKNMEESYIKAVSQLIKQYPDLRISDNKNLIIDIKNYHLEGSHKTFKEKKLNDKEQIYNEVYSLQLRDNTKRY